MIDFLLKGVLEEGNSASIKLVQEGHLAHYERELQAFRLLTGELEKALLSD